MPRIFSFDVIQPVYCCDKATRHFHNFIYQVLLVVIALAQFHTVQFLMVYSRPPYPHGVSLSHNLKSSGRCREYGVACIPVVQLEICSGH